jgi:peptide/nickel transport system substrate-binding protein
VSTRPGVNYSYLGFNLADPLTGRPEVRRALAHSIDRVALVRWLFGGRARLAEGLFPPDHWAGHPGLLPYEHDPGLARRLLREAGLGPRLKLVLKTTADPFRVRLATAIQAQAAESGIELKIQGLDWGTFFGDIKAGRFQLCALSWVGVRTPDIFRYAFHSASLPPAGANRGRYGSAEADRLIGAAGAAGELEFQAGLYRRLAERLHSDLPCLGLWYEDQTVAARTGLSGCAPAIDGGLDWLDGVELESGHDARVQTA